MYTDLSAYRYHSCYEHLVRIVSSQKPGDMSNIYRAMNRDPKYFPDFEEFRPERYLDKTGELRESIPDTHNQGHLMYGTGRRSVTCRQSIQNTDQHPYTRICVGKDVANQSLFMDFATLLWAFEIKTACDADGHELTPSRTEVVDKGLVVCVR